MIRDVRLAFHANGKPVLHVLDDGATHWRTADSLLPHQWEQDGKGRPVDIRQPKKKPKRKPQP